jgi:hypothetical protein
VFGLISAPPLLVSAVEGSVLLSPICNISTMPGSSSLCLMNHDKSVQISRSTDCRLPDRRAPVHYSECPSKSMVYSRPPGYTEKHGTDSIVMAASFHAQFWD